MRELEALAMQGVAPEACGNLAGSVKGLIEWVRGHGEAQLTAADSDKHQRGPLNVSVAVVGPAVGVDTVRSIAI